MDRSQKRKTHYNKPGRGGFNNWSSKKKFKNYLQPGMKGFICTCNTTEKDCIREAYNILNEYADKLYVSEEKQPQTNNEATGGAALDESEDIEDELKREVSSLKADQRTPGRFNTVDTGVKNNVFIKTMLEDPVKLAHTILSDVAATKTQKARFLLRIVPVEVTCRANLEEIKRAADTLFDKHFRCEPTTFAVVINKRYNDSILRDDVIHALALLVTDKNNEHKANLKEAKMTVLVEILKGLCCMSVLEDYKKLRHYNLAELTKPESTNPEKVDTVDSEKPAEETTVTDETEANGSNEDGDAETEATEQNETKGNRSNDDGDAETEATEQNENKGSGDTPELENLKENTT